MYYDYEEGRRITDEDGCELDRWMDGKGGFKFSVTPEGAKVFISPDEIRESDEHQHGDPYRVKEGLKKDSFFEKRRFNCTKNMIKKTGLISNKDNIRVLDVGCGEGYITEDVQKMIPSATVVGLDYSISAIRRAASRESKIEWVVDDAYNLPFQEKYFDVIICTNVWEHVSDPVVLLKKFGYIVRGGGYFVMSTPSRFRARNLVRAIMGKRVVFMSENHVTEYTVGQVKEQFEFAGVNTLDVKGMISGRPRGKNAKSIFEWLLKFVGTKFLNVINSHHTLASTAFYLGRFR